jgi:hypothetical protein
MRLEITTTVRVETGVREVELTDARCLEELIARWANGLPLPRFIRDGGDLISIPVYLSRLRNMRETMWCMGQERLGIDSTEIRHVAAALREALIN